MHIITVVTLLTNSLRLLVSYLSVLLFLVSDQYSHSVFCEVASVWISIPAWEVSSICRRRTSYWRNRLWLLFRTLQLFHRHQFHFQKLRFIIVSIFKMHWAYSGSLIARKVFRLAKLYPTAKSSRRLTSIWKPMEMYFFLSTLSVSTRVITGVHIQEVISTKSHRTIIINSTLK